MIQFKPKPKKGDLAPKKRSVNSGTPFDQGKVATINRANSGDFQHAAFKAVPNMLHDKAKSLGDTPPLKVKEDKGIVKGKIKLSKKAS